MQYGVHVNGYFVDENGKMLMWIARRSSTKQTWPGKLDQIVSVSNQGKSTICRIFSSELFPIRIS